MTDAARPPNTARLTLAQQALANSMAFVSTQTLDDTRTPMVLAALADVLAAADRDVPPGFQAMIEAARNLVDAADMRAANVPYWAERWMSANLRARHALVDFFFWRGALAIDAWKSTVIEPTGAAPDAV